MSVPSRQKALLLPRCGPDAAYELGERAVPYPGAGEVLIRNTAVALNPIDAFGIRVMGLYVSNYGWPAVAGYDAAGTIAVLGPDVKGWAVGDVVLYQGWFKADYGAFQEYTLSDASLIARVPDNITIEKAATVPSGFSTAVFSLYNAPGEHSIGLTAPWEEGGRGKYAGQAALVIGGSSSMGQLAIQMLRISGFSPIIATASSSNEAYCKRAGATHVVDYRDVPYAALPDKIVELLSGKPLTLAFDAIAVLESQQAAWAALAPNGNLIALHFPVVGTGETAEQGKRAIMVHGVAKSEENVEIGKRMFSHITELLASGDVKVGLAHSSVYRAIDLRA
ncbi:GroES-like protein [Peniophora sp. CONT]|nr:GroES-like protein [Peniophora sp. CONT]